MAAPIDPDTLAKVTATLLSGNPWSYDFYMNQGPAAMKELTEVIEFAKVIIKQCRALA